MLSSLSPSLLPSPLLSPYRLLSLPTSSLSPSFTLSLPYSLSLTLSSLPSSLLPPCRLSEVNLRQLAALDISGVGGMFGSTRSDGTFCSEIVLYLLRTLSCLEVPFEFLLVDIAVFFVFVGVGWMPVKVQLSLSLSLSLSLCGYACSSHLLC